MNTFTYFKPADISALLNLLEQSQQNQQTYRILAGGTDLLVRLRTHAFEPQIVIDIKGVAELQGEIQVHGNEVTIPALTLMALLEDDPFIKETFPALAEAAHNIGSVQIRNRATLAGNICNASPAADSSPALIIYHAAVNCCSPSGERTLLLTEFITGPGKTALKPGEFVKSITLPLPPKNQAAVFSRLSRRKGVDLATINLCCQVSTSGVTRFVLGAVGPVPILVEDQEGILISQNNSDADKKKHLEKMMLDASPITDVRASQEYRQAMLTVLGFRALKEAQQKLSTLNNDNHAK